MKWNFGKTLERLPAGTPDLWSRIYRRRAGSTSWPARAAKARRSAWRAFVFLLFLGAFLLGFVLPAVVFDGPARVLTGGLVDGRLVAAFALLVAVAVLFRYGFTTSSNERSARGKPFWLILAALKALGIGTAVGGVALISQCPIEAAAIIMPDEYDYGAGELHRLDFLTCYVRRVEELERAGLAPEHATPRIAQIVRDARRLGVTELLASNLMVEVKSLGRVEPRLQNLRKRLKDRRGDRVVVISAHRWPPATDLLRACWPLPETVFAEWVCANSNAKPNGVQIPETRVLSFWIASDPLLGPLARVTASGPTSTGCKLTWKLLPRPDLSATPIAGATLDAPSSSTAADPGQLIQGDCQMGLYAEPNTVTFAWQFPLPRYAEPAWLAIDLQAPGAPFVSHPWREPVPLAPNRLRIRADSPAAADLIKQLPGYGATTFPLEVDPTAVPGKGGAVAVAVGPLKTPPDPKVPTLELIASDVPALPAGQVQLLPAYAGTVLGSVTIMPGLTEAWPDFGAAVAAPAGAEVLAKVQLPSNAGGPGAGGHPVVFRRQPTDHPGWVTVMMPTATLRAVMSKDAALGHRHLVYFAASLAERLDTRRSPWVQPYRARNDADTPTLTSGKPLEDTPLLSELLTALARGGADSVTRSTPDNSAVGPIAPSIPAGLALTALLTAPAALIVVVVCRRRHPNASSEPQHA